jgi:dihydroflavonol-4-reductase
LGPQARKVPTRTLPNFLVRLVALWDPLVRSVLSELGRTRNMDASHAKAVLGWATRPEEKSLVDCAKSLVDKGIVKV